MAACKKAALTCGLPKIRLAALFENVNRFGRKIFATAWLGREVRRRRTVPTRRVARRLPSHPRTRMTGSAHTPENGPIRRMTAKQTQANRARPTTTNRPHRSPFLDAHTLRAVRYSQQGHLGPLAIETGQTAEIRAELQPK